MLDQSQLPVLSLGPRAQNRVRPIGALGPQVFPEIAKSRKKSRNRAKSREKSRIAKTPENRPKREKEHFSGKFHFPEFCSGGREKIARPVANRARPVANREFRSVAVRAASRATGLVRYRSGLEFVRLNPETRPTKTGISSDQAVVRPKPALVRPNRGFYKSVPKVGLLTTDGGTR